MRKAAIRQYVESDEQIKFFSMLSGVPCCATTLRDFVFAIPNAGSRGGRAAIRQAVRKVAEGLTKGVPDICCILPSKDRAHHSLWIEMKRPDGKPSDVKKEQRDWIGRLNNNGHLALVAYGWQDAWQIIHQYLGLDPGRSNSTSTPSTPTT